MLLLLLLLLLLLMLLVLLLRLLIRTGAFLFHRRDAGRSTGAGGRVSAQRRVRRRRPRGGNSGCRGQVVDHAQFFKLTSGRVIPTLKNEIIIIIIIIIIIPTLHHE